MDLNNEFSAIESVEDNEVLVIDKNSDNVGDSRNKVESNRLCAVLHDKQLDAGVNGEAVEVKESEISSPAVVGKSLGSGLPSPGIVKKGYGLRKWRRIKREVIKDGVGNADSSKLLKRGLPNAVGPSGKPVQFYADIKQKSEGSVSSTDAIERGPGNAVDRFAISGDSGLVMGPVFAAGTDSENSEDQSSKSSTAASVPKTRYEGPVAVGHMHDKYRMRSLSGKNTTSSVQRVQQGKARTETTKKPRGERAKIEEENSHSSIESELRSSNFVFMQGTNSVTSNGPQNGRSLNYDGNNSDGAHVGEQKVSEELRFVYGRKNGDFKDYSPEDLAAGLSWGDKEETSENQECSKGQDPMVEPIQLLQSVQEALEREVQKFREIGKEDPPTGNSTQDSLPSESISVGLGVQNPNFSEQLPSSDHVPHSLHALEFEITSLKETVDFLESKIDETTTMLKVKEAKVVELEAALYGRSLEEQSELEALFRQKIEAEVEYLAISRTIHNLRVLSVDQISLLEEQKKLASEQPQMFNKLKDAESKGLKLKREAQELEKINQDVLSTRETLKLQNSVCKYSSCLLIQLMMLAIILGPFILRFSPHSAGVVPT